jgi:methylmalonyl-CoA mutase N-terminal domain/subunit
MSVRIQQILQEETNIQAVTDPLGGSYYVETLTAELVDRAWEFFDEIMEQGGFLASLDSGWLHERAAENQSEDFRQQESGEQVIIGVTDHKDDVSPFDVDGFMGVDDAYDVALERLQEVRRTRYEKGASQALGALESVCRDGENIMPAMMDALAAEVTLGEIGDVYRSVFGDWATPIQT